MQFAKIMRTIDVAIISKPWGDECILEHGRT